MCSVSAMCNPMTLHAAEFIIVAMFKDLSENIYERCRQLVRQGIDPIEKRKAERLSA
ncbi:hypothetical protein RYZ26_17850 [Terasakiella sp. A23]|uniref:hypothetical protein n=1 Tax=Terasakiella sp. FCG-A23 TaxID=3080561 RepID=UPI002955DA79|nr:hypothetical protein [Terasakiella sp. A23]MDV7341478.1 hypothetical protein [Terasakiella sp. A23]